MNKVLLKSAFCALFYLLATNVIAQTFYSYEEIVASNSLRTNNNFDFIRAKKLVSELHPKLYLINNSALNTSAPNSYYADVDVSSLQMLETHRDANRLEIIKINVKNSDRFSLDLAQIGRSYPGLKYVYVVCDFQCDINYIRNFFRNNNPSILIIYAISIPS